MALKTPARNVDQFLKVVYLLERHWTPNLSNSEYSFTLSRQWRRTSPLQRKLAIRNLSICDQRLKSYMLMDKPFFIFSKMLFVYEQRRNQEPAQNCIVP